MSFKIVADNSETDIQKHRAREQIGYPLRELTANLMRLSRGGGHAYRLPGQLQAVIKAYGEFAEAHGHFPMDEDLRAELDPDESWRSIREHWLRSDGTEDEGRRLSLRREVFAAEVRDASIQIVASMLMRQIPQQSQGEHAFWRNFYALRDAHDEMLAHHNRKYRTTTTTAAKRRSKRRDQTKVNRPST